MSELTKRQREVVRGLLRGETYAEIAERLGIAARTVRMHVETIARDVPGQGPPKRRVRRHFAPNLTLSDVA